MASRKGIFPYDVTIFVASGVLKNCDNFDLFLQVGGEFFPTVVFKMKEFGRVSCCGAISHLNDKKPVLGR